MILTIVLVLIASCYFIMMARLLYGWLSVRNNERVMDVGVQSLSIVIAMRNEESTIGQLILDLQEQDLSPSEIIIVDDYSTDKSYSIVADAAEKDKRIRLVRLDEGQTGKKKAIERAVAEASSEWIVFTDADVRLGKSWLKTLASSVIGKDLVFVSGPVSEIGASGPVGLFSEMEFLALAGTGAAGFGLKRPLICNGANMAARRACFPKPEDLPGIEFSSGDDVFLLQYFRKNYPGKLAYVKDRNAVVTTLSESKLMDFMMQRARWISKNSGVSSAEYKLMAVLVALINFSLIFSFCMTAAGIHSWMHFAMIFGIKTIADYLLLFSVSDFFRRKWTLAVLPVFNVVYPEYLLVLMLYYGLQGRVVWKGRKVK